MYDIQDYKNMNLWFNHSWGNYGWTDRGPPKADYSIAQILPQIRRMIWFQETSLLHSLDVELQKNMATQIEAISNDPCS